MLKLLHELLFLNGLFFGGKVKKLLALKTLQEVKKAMYLDY
jgi:hypothetical protein